MTLIEKSVHLSLIALAVTASAVLIVDHSAIRVTQSGERLPGMVRATAIGRKISVQQDRGQIAEINVILALRSDCRYCRASLPLYRRILDLANKRGSKVAVQVVTEEDPAQLRAFLESKGLAIRSIARERFAALGVAGTPTIMLADSKGTVRDELVGALAPERGDALIQDLSKPGTAFSLAAPVRPSVN